MSPKSLHFYLSACGLTILLTVSLQLAFAQSQASNGQIEGGVIAQDGSSVPGVTVTAINVGTGSARRVFTDENGIFRFPLLPLGSYRVTVEAPGFKKLVHEGVTLTTGRTASLSLVLEVGDLRESVTVTSDAPVADSAKIDLGRVMNSREVKNLPLITLNPYTFVFLQSNVTGNRTAPPGIGSSNVNANGFSRRGNYQLDGNNATDIKQGGNRMLIISRTYIQEIQLLTNGMSAEFGGTVGHVMNVVTPSGTNAVHGDVGYQFRREGFAAQRFNVPPGAPKHDPVADVFTASIGGPIVKDRWHYYMGFEAFEWDLASAARTITITEANKQALIAAGIPASIMPTSYKAPETFRFFIGRTDLQITPSNRLGIRFFVTTGGSDQIGGNRLNTLETSIDTNIRDTSFAAQLVSNRGDSLFNELRVQRSTRDASVSPNEFTGTTGTVIRIPGVAVFGSYPGNLNEGQSHLSTFQNNLSYIHGRHSIKVGGGFTYHDSVERSDPADEYQFQNIPAFASSGGNRRSYSRYRETFGDPTIATKAVFWNVFFQDEWKVSRRLRINAGLRYDLFIPPRADPSAAYIPSRKFRVDKNNFGPRLGISFTVSEDRRPAVIRASAGIYHDPPIINYYVAALRNNGSSRFFTVDFFPNSSPIGPEFPAKFDSFPTGQSPPPFSIEALDPNFKTMSALHANFQFEKALTEDLAFTIAYSHSSGRHIPTSRAVNCLPVGGTLADGRSIYGELSVNAAGFVTVAPCTVRSLPEFRDIKVWESVGNLNYNAATLILSKRFSSGYQFSVNYTLARSTDDAPEENLGPMNAASQSDPSNRRFDRAVSVADQTHTLAATFVGRPRFKFESRVLNYIANQNLFSVIVRASSGERYNSVTNIDLNRDGISNDRPVGIPRNFLKTPRYLNVDVRYSRIVSLTERFGLELFADIVNVTNTNSITAFGNTIFAANHATNSLVNPFTGELRGPVPDFAAGEVVSTDSRRMQLGIKFNF